MLTSSQDNLFWHFPLVTCPGHIGSEYILQRNITCYYYYYYWWRIWAHIPRTDVICVRAVIFYDFDVFVLSAIGKCGISIIILHPMRLGFLIFKIKYCRTEILEQPGGGTLNTLNVMAISEQHHTSTSKQMTLLADVVALPHGTD